MKGVSGLDQETPFLFLKKGLAFPATGFEPKHPGGSPIDQVIAEFDLKCNPCGYPIVGPDLRWGERIFVTGPLAELQLGPCARNIVGARNAGRFLTAAVNR